MEAIREKYVEPWIKAFPNAMFLMRRPFSHASKHGMGLYNDMTGESGETEAWLKEIENGGDLSQTDEKNVLFSMHDFWKKAPAEVLEDVRNVVLTLQKKGILL